MLTSPCSPQMLIDLYCCFWLWNQSLTWLLSYVVRLLIGRCKWFSVWNTYLASPLNFKLSRCIKASFYLPESRLISLQLRSFRRTISMKLFYQHMAKLAFFSNFSPASYHPHPLQAENCDSNSRLVVDEDDNGKFRLERVKTAKCFHINHGNQRVIFNLKSP